MGDSLVVRDFISRKRGLFDRGAGISTHLLESESLVHLYTLVTNSGSSGLANRNTRVPYIYIVFAGRKSWESNHRGGTQDGG